MEFLNCQFSAPLGSSAPSGYGVVLSSATNSAHISGIRFIGCDFYWGISGAYLSFSANARCDDIWFQTCQFEGAVRGSVSTRAIQLLATGSGTFINDIHIDHCYMAGNGYDYHIYSTIASSSSAFAWFITNNMMNSATSSGTSVDATGGSLQGLTFSGNIQRDCGSTTFTNAWTNVNYCNFVGNAGFFSGAGTGAYYILLFTGSNYNVVTGNNSADRFTTPYQLAGANNVNANNL
jgi:hypothetical protein